MKVIVITSPQPGTQAESFKRHLKDLFDGKYVFSGKYDVNGKGDRYPTYYVVRLPNKNEEIDDNISMDVDKREVLDIIPTYKIKAKKLNEVYFEI